MAIVINSLQIMLFNNWGEPERAPPYDLAIKNDSMIHAQKQHDQKRSQSSHVPPFMYNLWNMVPWFIIKQTQTETAKSSRANPPTVLLFHDT